VTSEQLLLRRQVPLDLDGERRTGNEFGQQGAEQAMPVARKTGRSLK
jgi:hypothetical protein